MGDIVAEFSVSILRLALNRPAKKNAMISAMYTGLADIFDDAVPDRNIRAALWYGEGDSVCAGNDVEDSLRSPPSPGASPQTRLMNSLFNFDKPLIAAVRGSAIGGGVTMPLRCDFVYASEIPAFNCHSNAIPISQNSTCSHEVNRLR